MHFLSTLNSVNNIQTSPIDPQIKATRQGVYCGLKERWWKQIYDGKYHNWERCLEYGPKVFDLGLHGREAELGYYQNVKKACEFACSHLMEETTIEMYKDVHKIACAHFELKKKGDFDRGIDGADYCHGSIEELFRTKEKRDFIAKYEMGYKYYTIFETQKACGMSEEKALKEMKRRYDIDKEDFPFYAQWKANVDLKIDKVNTYIAEKSKQLGTSCPVAILKLYPHQTQIKVCYYCKPNEVDSVVSNLFKEFSKKMSSSSSDDEKIKCIADVYQMLEWIHPFPDGQGRTDLVMLGKWLSENGLNPAILDHPYVSTFNTLDDWFEYLKEGMEAWRKEAISNKFALTKPLFVEENQQYWNW